MLTIWWDVLNVEWVWPLGQTNGLSVLSVVFYGHVAYRYITATTISQEHTSNVSREHGDFECVQWSGACVWRKTRNPKVNFRDVIMNKKTVEWNYRCSFWSVEHLILLFPFSSAEDLSEMLAAGTKEVHEKAENTQFVKDFLRGRIRKELFKVRIWFKHT